MCTLMLPTVSSGAQSCTSGRFPAFARPRATQLCEVHDSSGAVRLRRDEAFASHEPRPRGLELGEPACVLCSWTTHAAISIKHRDAIARRMPTDSMSPEAPLQTANVATAVC
jgi:hypothetical protein